MIRRIGSSQGRDASASGGGTLSSQWLIGVRRRRRFQHGVHGDIPGGGGIERRVGQIESGRAVARLLQVDQHGGARWQDQEIAGMRIERDQRDRRSRLIANWNSAAQASSSSIARRACSAKVGGIQEGRLEPDLVQRFTDRIGMVAQRWAGRCRRERAGQWMDASARHDRRQIVRQDGRTARNLIDQQRSQRHRLVRQQDGMQSGDMAPRRRPLEAGRLIGQVDRRRKSKLALLRYAQKHAVSLDPDMVMGKTGCLKRNQVLQPHLAVIGQADEAPVYGLKERIGNHGGEYGR